MTTRDPEHNPTWYVDTTDTFYPARCPTCGRVATYDPTPDPDAADLVSRCGTCGAPLTKD